MDVARKIENVKVDRRGRCIDDVRVVDCGVLEEWNDLVDWLGGFNLKVINKCNNKYIVKILIM